MAGLVVDASAIVAFVLEEIADPEASWARRLANEGGIAPAHFSAEIANALIVAVRRRRIDEQYRKQRIIDVAKLPIEIEPSLDWDSLERVSGLAQRHRLSVYDAIYLDLARRSGLPLATYDDALAAAAKEAGVALAT
jgi:predicted nucleic acid-binding protein